MKKIFDYLDDCYKPENGVYIMPKYMGAGNHTKEELESFIEHYAELLYIYSIAIERMLEEINKNH